MSMNLNKRLGLDNQVMRVIGNKARRDPKRIVFAEADNIKILKAAQIVFDEGIGYPILLGDEKKIKAHCAWQTASILKTCPSSIRAVMQWKKNEINMANCFFKKRQRKGFNAYEAKKMMKRPQLFWLHDGGNAAMPMR